jgi:hypothetical protein
MGDASNHFWYKEFGCRCSLVNCPLRSGLQITHSFVLKLDLVRDALGVPMHPTSGCRCSFWNKVVGGKKSSMHMMEKDRVEKGFGKDCCAADFEIWSGIERFIVASVCTDLGLSMGISDRFIHIDDRSDPIVFPYRG